MKVFHQDLLFVKYDLTFPINSTLSHGRNRRERYSTVLILTFNITYIYILAVWVPIILSLLACVKENTHIKKYETFIAKYGNNLN